MVEDCTFLCDYLRYADTFSVENNCLYHYIRNDSSICAKYHDRQFEYYRFGNEAKKKLIGTLDEDQREALFEENMEDAEYFVRDGKLVVFKPYVYMINENGKIKYDFEIGD